MSYRNLRQSLTLTAALLAGATSASALADSVTYQMDPMHTSVVAS